MAAVIVVVYVILPVNFQKNYLEKKFDKHHGLCYNYFCWTQNLVSSSNVEIGGIYLNDLHRYS